MQVRDLSSWMWGEALTVLERGDRLQRQFCQLGENMRGGPRWEPPIDVFETEDAHGCLMLQLHKPE
jgi:HSP20 family protein